MLSCYLGLCAYVCIELLLLRDSFWKRILPLPAPSFTCENLSYFPVCHLLIDATDVLSSPNSYDGWPQAVSEDVKKYIEKLQSKVNFSRSSWQQVLIYSSSHRLELWMKLKDKYSQGLLIGINHSVWGQKQLTRRCI